MPYSREQHFVASHALYRSLEPSIMSFILYIYLQPMNIFLGKSTQSHTWDVFVLMHIVPQSLLADIEELVLASL